MHYRISKIISLVLVLIIFITTSGQVYAKGNSGKNKKDRSYNQQLKEYVKELEPVKTKISPKEFDKDSLSKLNHLHNITSGSALIISADKNDDSSDNSSNTYDSDSPYKLDDAIQIYENLIEEKYYNDVTVRDDELFNFKHDLAIILKRYIVSDKTSGKQKVLAFSTIESMYMSNEILSENAGNQLYYLRSTINNKFEKKEYDQMVKRYENEISKVDDFLQKGLIIPAFKSYEKSFDSYIRGMKIVGINFDDEYLNKDSDMDTILNGDELVIGTNPLDEDSDDDGLNDGVEFMHRSRLSPLLFDTDDDGVSDGKGDLDKDNLTNKEEVVIGTDLVSEDTDFDGLTDGFEVNVYGTDPLKYDTDNDGLMDGDEYALETDPNNQDTDYDGVIDSNEMVNQTVEENIQCEEKPGINSVKVSFRSNHNIKKSLSIEENYGKNELTSNVPGLVGSPIKIESSLEFEEAVLTFSYDQEILETINENNLDILWYNEKEEEFVLLDATVDTEMNSVSVSTSHFSEYMLVDKQQWYEKWRMNLDYGRETSESGETNYYDIVLAIDSSGSMSWNDSSNLRLDAAKGFVNAFIGEDQGAVVDFDSDANLKIHLTQNKEDIKAAIDTIDSYGGTNINQAVTTSIEELTSSYANTSSDKIIILLTDGDGYYSTHSTQKAVDNEIVIHTIGLGDGVNQTLLQSISNQTGGIYYEVLNSEELKDTFERLEDDTVGGIDTTDSDGDGIYDVVEVSGMRIQNGEIITTNPENADTDGDGLLDGEEIQIDESYVNEDTETKYYKMKSDVNLVDTDYDGIDDKNDPSPYNNNFSAILSAHKDINVKYRVDYRDFFKDNTLYNNDLSVLGSIYSSIVYHNDINVIEGVENFKGSVEETFEKHGLLDVELYKLKNDYSDDDISEICIGHRLVKYDNETKEIIVVTVRGTNGTIEEWSSNFDVGLNTDMYWDVDNPYWRNKDNHKGFDVTANRLYDYILEYVNNNIDSAVTKSIYISGHSRGAAVSNVLGKLFEDNVEYESFVYTFATPNTTTSDEIDSYSTIFNIVNEDDIIPFMPIEAWEFNKYGTTKKISVEERYENHWFGAQEGTWEWLMDMDYDNDGGTNRTIKEFEKVASNRKELYQLTCDCHGDHTDNDISQTLNMIYYFDYESAQGKKEEIEESYTKRMIPEEGTPLVAVDIKDEKLFGTHRYVVESCQTPAFFMMTLADLAVNKKLTKYNVAPKYHSAKASFIISSGPVPVIKIGGMTHPHLQETYYLISRNQVKPLK